MSVVVEASKVARERRLHWCGRVIWREESHVVRGAMDLDVEQEGQNKDEEMVKGLRWRGHEGERTH